jgi:hypothetical protein
VAQLSGECGELLEKDLLVESRVESVRLKPCVDDSIAEASPVTADVILGDAGELLEPSSANRPSSVLRGCAAYLLEDVIAARAHVRTFRLGSILAATQTSAVH